MVREENRTDAQGVFAEPRRCCSGGNDASTALCLHGQQAKSLRSCCNQRDLSFCEECWRLSIAVGPFPLSID